MVETKKLLFVLAITSLPLLNTGCKATDSPSSSRQRAGQLETSDASESQIELSSLEKKILEAGYERHIEGVWFKACNFIEPNDAFRGYWTKREIEFKDGRFIEAFNTYDDSEEDCKNARLIETHYKIELMKQKIDKLKVDAADLDKDIVNLNSEVDAANQELSALLVTLSTLEDVAAIEETSQRIEEFGSKVNEWNDQIMVLEQRREDGALALLNLKNELDDLEIHHDSPVIATGQYTSVVKQKYVDDSIFPESYVVQGFEFSYDLRGQREGEEGAFIEYYFIASTKDGKSLFVEREDVKDEAELAARTPHIGGLSPYKRY